MTLSRRTLVTRQILVWACLLAAAPAPSQTRLSPGASEVAHLYSLQPLLDQLEQDRSLEAGRPTLETLMLRQQILESILSASLDVDGVLAEIDDESSQCGEVLAYLESRRDHALGINTIVSMVTSGGVGVLGQLLQIHHGTAGGIVGAVAGGTSMALSVFSIHQQQGGKHTLGVAPNMLAVIFDRKAEFHSSYPEAVSTYLNSVPPAGTGTRTRRQELVAHWTQVGRIDPAGTSRAQRRIELLTSGISLQQPLTIALLQDRAAMLADLHSQISLIKRDLSKVMLALKSK
jgi:hypothetical protein